MKELRFSLVGKGKQGTRWAGVLGDSLVDMDFDAVLIATPHKFHASITEQALKAGKHVLCEKPGAITSSEIKKNIALAKKKGLTYMIGYNYRFHDGFIKARKLYKKGVIGKLLFMRAGF